MSPRPRIPKAPVRRSATKTEAKAVRSNPAHLAMIRSLPCVVTGTTDQTEAHHLIEGFDLGRGMGRKSEDRWTIPLRHDVHDAGHRTGTPETWLMREYGIDARALAEALWRVSPDRDAALSVVWKHRADAAVKMRRAS